MEHVVKSYSLTKTYRKKTVVDHVNMTIPKGEIYALIGENGAGKSTLMKMLAGLSKPVEGSVELFENKSPETQRYRVGCLIDSPCMCMTLSVKGNLEMFAKAFGCYNKEHIDEILTIIGLKDHQNKLAKKLSLGMKQRLALGITLLGFPDFLILDEPMNGLDPTGIQEIRQLLIKINKEKNTTILISSHILEELSKVATTYGFIHKGKLVQEISMEQLQENCQRCLRIQVSDVKKAAYTLEKELQTTNYEVLNDSVIRVFDYVDSPQKVNTAFCKNDIDVFEIKTAGETLEEYYNDIMKGEK